MPEAAPASPAHPVLIVGAGPVGLALAGDLAQRNVASYVIERSDGAIEQPRMDMVGIRTMEYARKWGIVRNVETSPYPRDYPQDNVYVTSLTGYELGRERMPSMGSDRPPATSPQKRERCPQDMFDPILQRWARSSPCVTLRYRCELVALEHDDDGVVATVRDHERGTTETLTASYLVGCDGAASRVRELVGIPMSGPSVLTNTTNIIFRDPDLPQRHDKGLCYRFIVIGTEGTWATVVAINGGDRWRMSIVRSPEGGLSHDDIAAHIRRAVGVDFPFEILSVTNWKRRELVAGRYSEGRVFLAGDSAHAMSPTGGFGMNTGIGDAVDLSWKLDALLHGWGGAALAESYTAERRPIAERNAREASANLARMLSPGHNPALCDPTPEGDAVRKQLGVEFTAAMNHEWHTIGIHLGYRYDASGVIVSDGTPVPPMPVATYEPTTRPGARAPHAWLSDGRSTLDLFGAGFVLLDLAGDAAECAGLTAAAALRGLPLQTVSIDDPAIAALYERRYVLVRPDGHVAWRSDEAPADALAVIDTVRGAASPSTQYAYAHSREEAGS
jgi:2-polyprenyl-6-methoxyphenol hydroxylase-like FAD-dependent oxidoreductase